MGAPVLIGAGIGAVTSLATGSNPFKGALLGGVTGGAFGGASGFGSGFTEGGLFSLGSETAKQGITSGISGLADDVAAGTVPTVGVQYPTETFVNEGINQATIDAAFPSMTSAAGGIQNQSLLNEGMLTQADLARPDKLFYQTPDTLWEKTQQLGKQGYDWIKDNPYQALQGTLMAGSLMNPSQPNLPPQQSGGSIKQGQPPTIGKPLAVNIPQPRRKIRIG